MLAHKISIAALLMLASQSGNANQSIGTPKTISGTSVCQKYFCKSNTSQSGNETYIKTSLNYEGEKISLSITEYASKNKIYKAIIHIGLDYPNNSLDRSVTSYLNDIYKFYTGDKAVKESEEFFGGKITDCFTRLYTKQIGNRQFIYENLYKNNYYISECGQLNAGPSKKSNRFIRIIWPK
ncbi:hypothetical protein [Deinococcus sp. 23YEL01]|uniref:hypothetical protein n=1 Tax=Deinococcus sp. 23YEL01 TaxID=2745871 RepID=UPI001E4C8F3F|nr:hypothetical protein [Deinococcus sp. 23YEL01]MCD0170075.1 hypothetical protein [Deinococcus sp. 23YEL01]